MKKIVLSIAVLMLLGFSSNVMAQSEQHKEISKEVSIEDENGLKTLTIKTTENGNTKTEVFTGAAADKKIAELEKSESGTTKTMVVGDDGKQHLKIEKRIVIKEEIEEEN